MIRYSRILPLAILLWVACLRWVAWSASADYFPPAGDRWQRVKPESVGLDSAALARAVEFAQSQETDFPADFSAQRRVFGRSLGPLPKTRAATNGVIIRHGYILAEFGDVHAADPTYSAAKSFLSTVLGLAIDRGMIHSVDDPVARYISDGSYDSAQNRSITWRHHAQQCSEWEGEMWGKRHDFIGEEEFGEGRRNPRALQAPGSHYEYNDVRINRFSLSLLKVYRKPLPDVLRESVMNPIGASQAWRWIPYDNAWVEIDGKRMPSVSGGTRWGGGLWISALDEARFGLLFLRKGCWAGKQIISESWVREATKPGAQNPDYGMLWWLNDRDGMWKGLPRSSFAAVGHGSNTIWVDPDDDLVIVWRWHRGSGAEFFKRVVDSIRDRGRSPSE